MASVAIPVSAVRRGRSSVAVYAKEIRYEFLKLFRARSFSLSVIGFPVMFYVLFGLSNKGVEQHGVNLAKYMLAGYCSFGMIGAALFGVGVGLATERAAGWLELKRASPMPPMAYLLAKLVTAVAFGLLIVGVLTGLGVFFGGVHLTLREMAGMVLVTMCGVIPFTALGLLLAQVVPSAAASGIINLIYLPMSFMSGLWVPIGGLPKWVQSLAPWLPAYHLAQWMHTVFGYQQGAPAVGTHVAYLAGFTVVMLGASWMVFARAEAKA